MVMTQDYQIHINFIPTIGDIPDFCVHRRLRASSQEERPEGQDVRAYALPRSSTDVEKWSSYWISTQPRTGFEQFVAKPNFNHNLTCWVLLVGIKNRCRSELAPSEFWVQERGFIKELQLNLRHHAEGDEQLIVQPYYLRAKKKFGVLADFHFRLKEDVKFSRRIQQLCLSLDENYKRNLDFYADRLAKITVYLKEKWSVLSPINVPGAESTVELNGEFEPVLADRLQSRVYVLGNNRESRSQFIGLKDFGPLKSLAATPKLLFVFREQDRQAGRNLALALRGTRQRERYSFPGFEYLFKTPLEIDSNPVIVPDFSIASMETALQRTLKETNLILPILILPDDEDAGYLNHKAIFTHAGRPSQVCTLGVIQDENTLRWSVANIALQIFCKAGGWPWKVRATVGDCLIIGISQSHKVRKDAIRKSIDKYFAFSILTDSSGLFKKIQVLGQAEDEATYLEQLGANLRDALRSESQNFSRVVIHTSFKLKHREIDEIKKAVQDVASNAGQNKCRFAVIKVNHKSRFFGINQSVNSLIPYEATRVKLGHGEYLIWFEGIFPDKPTVTKVFPGPTHLQFLRVTDKEQINDQVLLQDLVNLSGANWRGFNAKSAPISVFYCHLVADLVHDFQERGLPLPVEAIQPWFL
jgi:hypothetical protein